MKRFWRKYHPLIVLVGSSILGLILGLIIAMLTITSCLAGDRWSTEDKILEGLSLSLLAIDWNQTRQIAGSLYETNPMIGRHPSKTKVDIYFLSVAVLHPLVTDLLPARKIDFWIVEASMREIFQGLTIGIEGGCVINNFSIGLGLRF